MSESETERRRTTEQTTADSNLKWLSGFVSLVGAWIFVSAFVYDTMSTVSYWNNVIVGLAIFLIAGYNYYRMTNGYEVSVGSAGFVALLGLWMILVPFVIADIGAAFWSDVISGIVVAGIAGYNAYAGREMRTGAPTRA
ncbi:SPW repeat protein [Halomicrococcus sp. NG-SE-24]|uniref:SPW repeat protein n=1 Tax=Halomicrococcus sp. NG-SE-24 TaxID=3436928 RepID=UPI003D96152E